MGEAAHLIDVPSRHFNDQSFDFRQHAAARDVTVFKCGLLRDAQA
jgi:hypothetical protein